MGMICIHSEAFIILWVTPILWVAPVLWVTPILWVAPALWVTPLLSRLIACSDPEDSLWWRSVSEAILWHFT